MDIFSPPEALLKAVPKEVGDILKGGGWIGVLAVIGLLLLLVLWMIFRKMFSGGESNKKKKDASLFLPLVSLPAPQTQKAERRIRKVFVEGAMGRLRLVVMAPAGRAIEIEEDEVYGMLEKVLPGLGRVAAEEQPVIRIWPLQLSYEGFANTFHSNAPLPPGEEEGYSHWILVAGRALVGKNQVMLGLAFQTLKPNTIARMRLDNQDWVNVLRIKESGK